MIDRLAGTRSAPATPWSARAAIEESDAGGEPAQHRGGDEPGQTGDEHPPPPVPVAGAATQQQEGRQRHEVGVEHPLQPPDRGAEVVG